MKILLTGANGQLGWEINQMARSTPGMNVVALTREQLDITNPDAVARSLTSTAPDIVINAAAYTAVDKAEKEVEQAFAVNRDAPAYIAQTCSDMGIPMIHISTDYVFDGEKTESYVETDPVNPINVYGQSKLEGEQAVIERLQQHIILRTSWVFGRHGNNFVKTMLRLFQEKDELKVVNDQFGCPTYTKHLVQAVFRICDICNKSGMNPNWGIYHYCDSPETNWYKFACSILAAIDSSNVSLAVNVLPTPGASYQTVARRPKNSQLICEKIESEFQIARKEWYLGLNDMVDQFTA